MAKPGRELLNGRIDVDETFIGGEHSGVRGRVALVKTLVEIAVELDRSGGFGRARIGIIENPQATTLRRFLSAAIEPGSSS
ncbi:transposase [Citricoccus nitrophenolicus]